MKTCNKTWWINKLTKSKFTPHKNNTKVITEVLIML